MASGRMAPVHPDLRRAGVALFHLGLVLAIAHVTVALEIGVTLSSQGSLVKSLVLLLYPVAVAMLGFGAALDRIVLRSDDPGPPLRASGAFLLLFLAVTLRLNFLSLDPTAQLVAAAAHFLVLGGWFLCAGVALARLVRVARMAGGHRTGALWATHQVGLVAGYLLQDLAVPVVGVNALHLVLALSLLLPTRLSLAALLGGCALAPMLDLDPGIDDLRDISVLQRVFAGHRVDEVSPAPVDAITADTITAGALPLRHRAWSRLGQFELFALDDGDSLSLRGWYNYQPQWGLRTPVRRGGHGPHHELYELIHPGERVAIIGVGGGGSLQALAHPSEDIVAIEREPAVVRYFTEVAPEDNGGIFLKVQTVAGDGRNYLERQTRPFDAIVFESAKYQPAHSLLPASSPYYLYTFESIRTAVDHLADDGWISLGFAQLKPKEGMEYLPLQARQSLSSLGLHATAFNTGEDGRIVVVGSRSRETMSEIGRSALASHGLWRPDSEASSIHEIRLTDARPFAAWTTMKPKDKRSLLGTAVAIGVACVVVASALAGRARRSLARRWNPVPYFLTIGVAQATFAVATCTMWRSFWQDDVLTVVRVLVWLIAWGGAGSALASRLPIARLHPWVRIAAFVAVFAAHFALTRAVPFEEPSLLRRELAAALLLAPGGLAMGTLFPLGLSAMSPRHTGLVLLADAIGALLGYVLLYLVALPLGVPAFATSAVGAYGVAAALWRPRPAAVPPEIPTRGASDGLVGDDGPSSSIAEVS